MYQSKMKKETDLFIKVFHQEIKSEKKKCTLISQYEKRTSARQMQEKLNNEERVKF